MIERETYEEFKLRSKIDSALQRGWKRNTIKVAVPESLSPRTREAIERFYRRLGLTVKRRKARAKEGIDLSFRRR